MPDSFCDPRRAGHSVAEPGPGDCRAALRRDRRDAGLPAVAGLWRQGRKVASSILGVVVLLIFALAVFGHVHSRDLPASAGAPQVGQKAPDFTLADTSGNKVSLGQLLGKADSANRVLITPPREVLGTWAWPISCRPPRQAPPRRPGPCCWCSIAATGDHSATSSYEASSET